jgi:hypothetical protein
MVEGRRRARLAKQPRPGLLIASLRRGQYFDGDIALQPRVVGAIHLAHATGTDGLDDPVRSKRRTPHRAGVLR